KLDVLIFVIAANGFVHQFIDDDVADQDGRVSTAGSLAAQPIELIAAIGVAASRDAILLPLETNRVQNPGIGRILEVDRFAGGAERKIHRGLGINAVSAWRYGRARRNHKLVGVGIV